MMLREYAREHGLHVVDEYIDDGWSGTNFDRPGFQRMIDDIEAGKVNCVVTKDLSRLGRNYILTGQYTEIYFPSKGVRYIAINDNVDTANGESELAPFLNILNEMHARQTSKKVKAALHTKYLNGAHPCTYAPVGYIKDPDQPGHLLVDPESKWIVEKIFALAAHGAGASKIMRTLTQEKVPTPGWLKYCRNGSFANIYANAPDEKRYAWTLMQVKDILKNECYIGNSIHYRQQTVSFKNKKIVRNPQADWLRIENTHEAIIGRDVFEQVQVQIANRRRSQKDGTTQIFAGLLKCADCGRALMSGGNKACKHPYRYYRCTRNHESISSCSAHYIRYDVLYAYVLDRLRFWADMASKDGPALLAQLSSVTEQEQRTVRKKQMSKLRKAEKRKAQVDSLMVKLYEDWSSERVTEYNFNLLSRKYQEEQTELDSQIHTLRVELETAKQDAEDTEKWVNLIQQYNDITVLDVPLLNALIERIAVHEAIKQPDGTREQEIEIYYRFVGKIE